MSNSGAQFHLEPDEQDNADNSDDDVFECFDSSLRLSESECPSSQDVRQRSRSVPIFQEMSPEDRINRVAIGLRNIGDEITCTRRVEISSNSVRRDRVHSVSCSFRSEVTEIRARRRSLRQPAHEGGGGDAAVAAAADVAGGSSWPGSGGSDSLLLQFVTRIVRTLSGADIDCQTDDEADNESS